jgi:hypothetical protein
MPADGAERLLSWWWWWWRRRGNTCSWAPTCIRGRRSYAYTGREGWVRAHTSSTAIEPGSWSILAPQAVGRYSAMRACRALPIAIHDSTRAAHQPSSNHVLQSDQQSTASTRVLPRSPLGASELQSRYPYDSVCDRLIQVKDRPCDASEGSLGQSVWRTRMEPIRKLALVAVLATVAGMTGANAQAQGQPGNVMGPGMMGGMQMGPGMMGETSQSVQMCAMMTGHVEGRLAYLRAELRITPTQEALWTTFANVVRENVQNMAGRCNTTMGQSGTAALSLPERLDLREQFVATHLDAMRASDKALKPLYAAFDDAQKRGRRSDARGSHGHGHDGHDVVPAVARG